METKSKRLIYECSPYVALNRGPVFDAVSLVHLASA
jgi:hypothetical protein